MATTRHVRLRVGVIGLGRLWEARHKPALVRMSDRFRITALYDQVARRAEIEANVLGAVATSGLDELLDRPDVDVIHIISPQWFGLHAFESAITRGKPVYCALPLFGDQAWIDRVASTIASRKCLVVPEFARRLYPASDRLKYLIQNDLGPVRSVVGLVRLSGFDRYGQPGPSTQIAPAPLMIDPTSYLLDWSRWIFGREPLTATNQGGTVLPGSPLHEHDVEHVALGFGDGAVAQWSVARHHRGIWGESAKWMPSPGVQIYCEHGAAWLEMPDRIVWTSGGATHDERLPIEPTIGEQLNAQFHQAVTTGDCGQPTWDDALTVARLILRLKGDTNLLA